MNQESSYTERAYTKLENLCYKRFKTMSIDDVKRAMTRNNTIVKDGKIYE